MRVLKKCCFVLALVLNLVCVCVQIQVADSVLVVGGGASGVEMAAEIKTEYPEKKVATIDQTSAG